MIRIFQAIALQPGVSVQLSEAASHHVARVLRANLQDPIILFNGEGGEYIGSITAIDKKRVTVLVQNFQDREVESSIKISLIQGISRGEKMDFTIQKAVELGVTQIVPVFTERCNVKLDTERSEKRLEHWRSIVIGACEQSGRNRIPEILLPQTLDKALVNIDVDLGLVLAPDAEKKNWRELSVQSGTRIALVVGPEGGLTEIEIARVIQHGFKGLSLGPRVMRTETAGIAGISVIQGLFGDF